MKHNSLSLIIVFVLLFSCSESKEATLENFNLDKDVFVSGASLMNFSFGLHDLEEIRQYQDTLLIGVHGSNSRGYEWIYPLQTLNENKNLVSFFRWDDDGCPDPSIDTLLKLIKDKTKNNPNLNKVILGHIYRSSFSSSVRLRRIR